MRQGDFCFFIKVLHNLIDVYIFHAGRSAVFVAGESGFARFDGQRFVSLSAERDDAFAQVTGVIETAEGDLWLSTLILGEIRKGVELARRRDPDKAA